MFTVGFKKPLTQKLFAKCEEVHRIAITVYATDDYSVLFCFCDYRFSKAYQGVTTTKAY